ncbi:hypothetical protein [Noviluteimonas gilva]|uniref:Uncharacterized protein n=1 Tax=Noviluteimonas gilva TaxID=2682097 RepID=A0A7C9HMH5_9GAMM|nr:hypothetical protein [Lysobacter gilvus]MUV14492.1 hypothetical protein [Lysobacter gilvus]
MLLVFSLLRSWGRAYGAYRRSGDRRLGVSYAIGMTLTLCIAASLVAFGVTGPMAHKVQTAFVHVAVVAFAIPYLAAVAFHQWFVARNRAPWFATSGRDLWAD